MSPIWLNVLVAILGILVTLTLATAARRGVKRKSRREAQGRAELVQAKFRDCSVTVRNSGLHPVRVQKVTVEIPPEHDVQWEPFSHPEIVLSSGDQYEFGGELVRQPDEIERLVVGVLLNFPDSRVIVEFTDVDRIRWSLPMGGHAKLLRS